MAIEGKPSNRSIPRWMAFILALFLWLVAIPLAHAVLPWAISWLSTRHGWIDGRPGIWNLIGLFPVVASTACLIWAMVVGFAETPERVELALTPSQLVTRGPYTFTRNPWRTIGCRRCGTTQWC
jgi:protein-S-isoprenylcysteine O-methyltransferase Ste14